MKINEVIKNSQPRICQIQQEAVFTDQRVQTQQSQQKNAPVQSSRVQQNQPQRRQVSTHPIPDQIKHKLIQDKLTKQLMRQSNIVNPTTDDIHIARDRVATELKRSNLEYQRELDMALQSN